LVQVGHEELPGYGGQASKPIGWQDSPYQNFPGYNGNGNGNGNGAGPIGSVQIPNNFWGFVMLVMGLR